MSTDQSGNTEFQGEALLTKSGTATMTTAILPVGTYSIQATYNGDNLNASSTSSAVTQTVNPLGTVTVTLTSSPNPSSSGQAVTFTAMVAAAKGTGTPTGNVTFYTIYGSTPLGMASLVGGAATFSYSALPLGINSIVAEYSGDNNFNAGNSTGLVQTVSNQPVITWPTPAAITYGTKLSATQLDATASMNGTPVAGKFVYTPKAGTVLTAGSQTLSVTFTPTNKSYSPMTATVPLTVNPVSTKTTINIVTVSTTNPLEVTVAFTVTQAIANVTKATGNVTVTAGTGETCTGTLASTGNSNNLTSTSAVKSVTVK
jgi:hypothetical protein